MFRVFVIKKDFQDSRFEFSKTNMFKRIIYLINCFTNYKRILLDPNGKITEFNV